MNYHNLWSVHKLNLNQMCLLFLLVHLLHLQSFLPLVLHRVHHLLERWSLLFSRLLMQVFSHLLSPPFLHTACYILAMEIPSLTTLALSNIPQPEEFLANPLPAFNMRVLCSNLLISIISPALPSLQIMPKEALILGLHSPLQTLHFVLVASYTR